MLVGMGSLPVKIHWSMVRFETDSNSAAISLVMSLWTEVMCAVEFLKTSIGTSARFLTTGDCAGRKAFARIDSLVVMESALFPNVEPISLVH